VCGRKLELKHFLNQQSVDIFRFIETLLITEENFRLANYIFHRTGKLRYGAVQPQCSQCYSPPLSARSGLADFEPVPFKSYWAENRRKSLRLIFRLAARSSERT